MLIRMFIYIPYLFIFFVNVTLVCVVLAAITKDCDLAAGILDMCLYRPVGLALQRIPPSHPAYTCPTTVPRGLHYPWSIIDPLTDTMHQCFIIILPLVTDNFTKRVLFFVMLNMHQASPNAILEWKLNFESRNAEVRSNKPSMQPIFLHQV